jgi:DNA-binding NtrC family response regulator
MKKSKKVLIIEDELKARKTIERALMDDADYDFTIKGAASVKEAAETIKKDDRRFDVVVIDWRLGQEKEGGLKVLEGIKAFFPKIKIVFTAYATIENCVKAMKAGADDYIDKNQPGSLQKLIDSIKAELAAYKFEENEPDPNWLDEHFDELKEKYSGQVLAFINGELVAVAPTQKSLLEKLKKEYGEVRPYIMYAPVEVFHVRYGLQQD